MVRQVNRRIRFDADDVRDALILWLKERNQAYPKELEDVSWKMDAHGADLEWDESTTVK